MDHKKFHLILNQLTYCKKTELAAFGAPLVIEVTEQEERWKLSTCLYSYDHEIPSTIHQCISPSGAFQWQEKGAYLKLDSEERCLYLIQEIDASKKYLPFKSLVYNFVQVADEWKEMLREMAD